MGCIFTKTCFLFLFRYLLKWLDTAIFHGFPFLDGADINPTELKRWNIEQEDEAKAELAKYECSYITNLNPNLVFIEEHALEYCLTNEDGEG